MFDQAHFQAAAQADDAAGSFTTSPRLPDRDQLKIFVDALFRYGTGIVSLRAFTHGTPNKRGRTWGGEYIDEIDAPDGKSHYVWPAARADDKARLVDAAYEMAQRAANASKPATGGVVFAPPVCTLTNEWSAKTEDIDEGLALSCEFDGPTSPLEGEDTARIILGPPTIAMASGGVWTDPETGKREPKVHMHWRLAQPTRTPEQHKKLREARNILAKITGSDASASSLVHPLRWPGSWHTKSEPVMARIIEQNDDIEIDLDDALSLLRQVAVELKIGVKPTNDDDTIIGSRRYERSGNDDETQAKVRFALSIVPNNLERKKWVEIAASLKDAFRDNLAEGRQLWHDFSLQWPGYSKSDSDKVWDSLESDGGVTVGTILGLAKEYDPDWYEKYQQSKFDHLQGRDDWLSSLRAAAELPDDQASDDAAHDLPDEPIDDDPVEDERVEDDALALNDVAVERDQNSDQNGDPGFDRAQTTWEPIDLFGAITPEPVLTRDMLPDCIADYVYEQSDLLGCDPGAMATAALAMCSALISDNIAIMPKRHDNTWYEFARLWVIFAGLVSSKKTPMLLKLTRALKKIEHKMRQEDAVAMERYKSLLSQYEYKKKVWDQKAAENSDFTGSPPERPEKPPRRRLITNDFTVESLALILCDNPRGLLIELDEIMALFGGFDAYKAGGVKKDRKLILELWNGGYRAVDRVRTADDPVLVPNWGATIIGGIQHAKLDEIGHHLVDDGLLQRFLLVPMKEAERESDRPPNVEIINRYEALIQNLVDHNPPDRIVVKQTEEAHKYRDQVEEFLHDMQHLPGISEGFKGHIGKLGGIYCRLLLTVHVIENTPLLVLRDVFLRDDDAEPDRFTMVSGETARRVYNFLIYFLFPHAVRQYERIYNTANQEQLVGDTRWLAGHILAKTLTQINKRVCHDASRTFKTEPMRAEKAMRILIDASWIDEGGKVNPRVHELFAERAERERQARGDQRNKIAKARRSLKKQYR